MVFPRLRIQPDNTLEPCRWFPSGAVLSGQVIGVIMGELRAGGHGPWADADAAVEAERAVRIKRVENATLVSALTLLLCAVWLAWPSIRGLSNGDGVVLASFGAPLLVLIWGIFVQDLTLDDPAARSGRLGNNGGLAAADVPRSPWFDGENAALVGSILVLIAGVMCRQLSHGTMRGNFGVLRYRAILTGIGSLSALALALTSGGALHRTADAVGPWRVRARSGRHRLHLDGGGRPKSGTKAVQAAT